MDINIKGRYREMTSEERTKVKRFFNEWGVFEYFQNKPLLIKEDIENNKELLYLVTEKVFDISILYNPFYAGIFLGIIKKKITPSLHMAEVIAKNSKKGFPYIIVNRKAEELMTYGRDIISESIVHISESVIEQNQLVIVLNHARNVVGIGRTNYSKEQIKINSKRVAVTNILDIGEYLRSENKYIEF